MIHPNITSLMAGLLLTLAPLAWNVASAAEASQTHAEHEPVEDESGGHLHRDPELSELGGTFTLTDQDGKKVTNEDFLGKYAFFYFGYSQCDMACPVALSNMVKALDQVDPNAEQVVPVFVDFNNSRLDPPKPRGSFYYNPAGAEEEKDEHDAHQGHGDGGSHMVQPRSLNKEEFIAYMQGIDPDMVGLVGTRHQIWNIMAKFKVRYEHTHVDIPGMDEPGNRIRHTTHLYLVGPDGNMAAVFFAYDSAEDMAEHLRELISQQPANDSVAMQAFH